MRESREPLIARFVTRLNFSIRSFAFLVIALSLMVRAAIPAGWMPSGERAFEVKICAGIEMQTAWLDKSGKLHKTDPSKKSDGGHNSKQDCAFASLATQGIAAQSLDVVPSDRAQQNLPYLASANVAVGRGLAAPPPPSTGPPTLV